MDTGLHQGAVELLLSLTIDVAVSLSMLFWGLVILYAAAKNAQQVAYQRAR